MINVNDAYAREVECEYKGERYKVRDNGAIFRIAREGKQKRAKDEVWTFGEKIDRGYAKFCGESVHRIVAVAFLGEPPSKLHVVDHLDTNRQNNRPENLRWLTRLENILLNPYTKAKIEFCCGSVENFLRNPSLLKGHEADDTNFAWMRAVTHEEAMNTLENWKNVLSKPRPIVKENGNAIEEWIFEQNHTKTPQTKSLFDDFELKENPIKKEAEFLPPTAKTRAKSAKQKVTKISKKELMTALIEVCEREGWTYEKNYKSDKWKTDILITTSSQKIAFTASNTTSTASKELSLMETNGVKGYAILLSHKSVINESFACFGLHKKDESLMVKVQGCELLFSDFVKKAIEGKIVHHTRTNITSVEVMFVTINCYFCKAPHSVFFVRYLLDANGKKHDYAEFLYDHHEKEELKLPDLKFGDEIVGIVKRYIAEHPEENIVMGEIKERYSRTMDESYMSFGCPKCDGIVGNHYLDNLEMDVMYETDTNIMHRMSLVNAFEIPVNEWEVKE